MDTVKVFRISFQAIFTYSVVMKDINSGLMEENQFSCIVASVHISSLKVEDEKCEFEKKIQ